MLAHKYLRQYIIDAFIIIQSLGFLLLSKNIEKNLSILLLYNKYTWLEKQKAVLCKTRLHYALIKKFALIVELVKCYAELYQ